MSSRPPRLQDYLAHVIEDIDRIGRYTAGIDEAEFVRNEMTQDAVIRNLEVIGEASLNIVREHAAFATAHPNLPLSFAYEMRNALAHGYFKVDLGIVWKTIEKISLPCASRWKSCWLLRRQVPRLANPERVEPVVLRGTVGRPRRHGRVWWRAT